jgi:hypothetical protein
MNRLGTDGSGQMPERRSIVCNGGVGTDPVDLEPPPASFDPAQHFFLEKRELLQQSLGVDGQRDGHGHRRGKFWQCFEPGGGGGGHGIWQWVATLGSWRVAGNPACF